MTDRPRRANVPVCSFVTQISRAPDTRRCHITLGREQRVCRDLQGTERPGPGNYPDSFGGSSPLAPCPRHPWASRTVIQPPVVVRKASKSVRRCTLPCT